MKRDTLPVQRTTPPHTRTIPPRPKMDTHMIGFLIYLTVGLILVSLALYAWTKT